MNYLDVANSSLMFFCCLVPCLVIVYQAVAFMRLAYKQGLSIGMAKEKLWKCIKSSAVISIVPALSLATIMVALSVNIGKFFPWLRLSNVGAGAYEAIAAEVGMNATGAGSFANLTTAGFVVVMLCMNLGMCPGPLVVLFTLKRYDRTLKKSFTTAPFLSIATAAAFVAIIAKLTVPYLVNTKDPLGIVAVATGALVMLACQLIGKKHRAVKDFGLSLALVAGAVVCILFAAISPTV